MLSARSSQCSGCLHMSTCWLFLCDCLRLRTVWYMLVKLRRLSGASTAAGVAVKPTCINRAALAAVRKYLRPRTLHVVTATQSQCDIFESWAPNIQCHLQVSGDAGAADKCEGQIADLTYSRGCIYGRHLYDV